MKDKYKPHVLILFALFMIFVIIPLFIAYSACFIIYNGLKGVYEKDE